MAGELWMPFLFVSARTLFARSRELTVSGLQGAVMFVLRGGDGVLSDAAER